MEYLIHIAIILEIYILLSLGLQIVLGWGGLFNLAQISLFGVGAYTAAILSTDYNVSPLLALIMSPIVATALALIIGLISLRLKHDYFVIGSLAFAFVVTTIFINFKWLTHGVLGIPGIPRPQIFNISLDENIDFLIFSSLITLIFILVSIMLSKSPFGRALIAQSESEDALSAIGISPVLVRILSFALSAFYAGIAGAIFSFYMSFIDPTSFSLNEMVYIISMVILSGMRRIRAVIGATAFLVILPEALRFLSIPDSILGPLRQFIYALILFLVLFIRRKSLFPMVRNI